MSGDDPKTAADAPDYFERVSAKGEARAMALEILRSWERTPNVLLHGLRAIAALPEPKGPFIPETHGWLSLTDDGGTVSLSVWRPGGGALERVDLTREQAELLARSVLADAERVRLARDAQDAWDATNDCGCPESEPCAVCYSRLLLVIDHLRDPLAAIDPATEPAPRMVPLDEVEAWIRYEFMAGREPEGQTWGPVARLRARFGQREGDDEDRGRDGE